MNESHYCSGCGKCGRGINGSPIQVGTFTGNPTPSTNIDKEEIWKFNQEIRFKEDCGKFIKGQIHRIDVNRNGELCILWGSYECTHPEKWEKTTLLDKEANWQYALAVNFGRICSNERTVTEFIRPLILSALEQGRKEGFQQGVQQCLEVSLKEIKNAFQSPQI